MMKKFLFLLATISLVLMLAACGEEEEYLEADNSIIEPVSTHMPLHYFSVTGRVVSVEGLLNDDGTLHTYIDFATIHIEDENGNPAVIVATGFSNTMNGTASIGAIEVDGYITAYISSESPVLEDATYLASFIVGGGTDELDWRVGWFRSVNETFFMNNIETYTFRIDSDTVFTTWKPDFEDGRRFVGVAVVYADFVVGERSGGFASQVFVLHDQDWNTAIGHMKSAPLPENFPMSDFEISPLPIVAFGHAVDSPPAIIANDGTMMLPFTALSTFLTYHVSRTLDDGKLSIHSEINYFMFYREYAITVGCASFTVGENIHNLNTPPILVEGVVYVPFYAFTGLVPLSNAHVRDTFIEIYCRAWLPQGSGMARFGRLLVEEPLPIVVNGQTIDATSLIAISGHVDTSYFIVPLEPILYALGYSTERHGEFMYVLDESLERIVTLNVFDEADARWPWWRYDDWLEIYELRVASFDLFAGNVMLDGLTYVPLTLFFRDVLPSTNAFIGSELVIYTVPYNERVILCDDDLQIIRHSLF